MKNSLAIIGLSLFSQLTASTTISQIEVDRGLVKNDVYFTLSDGSRFRVIDETGLESEQWEEGKEVQLSVKPTGYLTGKRTLSTKQGNDQLEVTQVR